MTTPDLSATHLIFITGGARSGKSRYAQDLALQYSQQPVYVATARKWDEDFEKRIQRHQSDRDERWTSLEEEKQLSTLPLDEKVAVIDCVTLWLTNYFSDLKADIDQCLEAGKQEILSLLKKKGTFIIISNEIGMGLHAETVVGRKFTDLQGWMNQFIAEHAQTVIFMVSGVPLYVKGKPLI